LTDISTLEMIGRLVLAAALGSVLGYERETRSKTAGLRTHTLVALGAAMFTLAGAFGIEGARVDPGRLAAGVVTGIGFIGAGTIMRSGIHVTGLTTAATLWVAAALGVGAAVGLYAVTITGSAGALFSLLVLGSIRPSRIFAHQRRLELLYEPGHGTPVPLYASVNDAGGDVRRVWMSEDDGLRHLTMVLSKVDDQAFQSILTMLIQREEVFQITPRTSESGA